MASRASQAKLLSTPRRSGSKVVPSGSPRSGVSARVTLQVTEDDTALTMRSGDVPVLGTPRLVALCEEACCRVLDERLESHQTSVASRVQFDHLAPVAVGSEVTAEACLERVEGRRFVFTVSASTSTDNYGALVGAGRVTRVLVDREAFLAKAGLHR